MARRRPTSPCPRRVRPPAPCAHGRAAARSAPAQGDGAGPPASAWCDRPTDRRTRRASVPQAHAGFSGRAPVFAGPAAALFCRRRAKPRRRLRRKEYSWSVGDTCLFLLEVRCRRVLACIIGPRRFTVHTLLNWSNQFLQRRLFVSNKNKFKNNALGVCANRQDCAGRTGRTSWRVHGQNGITA